MPTSRRRVVRKRAAKKWKPAARSLIPPESKMLTALGEVDFEHRTITNSMRSTFLACERLGLYQYGYQMTPRQEPHYFFVGGCVHDEYEHMYLDGYWDEVEGFARIDSKTKEALKYAVGAKNEEQIWTGNAVSRGLVKGYAEHYLARDLAAWNVLECEGSAELIQIPGTDWRYTGKRDMVISLKKADSKNGLKPGAVGLVENKTTAQIDTGYIARLPLDHQILGYIWTMQQPKFVKQFGKPQFIEYNPTKKTQLRLRKSESRGQYLQRVEEDYLNDPHKYFYRERLLFKQAAIDAFVAELVQFTKRLDWMIENNTFTMNPGNCASRGLCAFMPVCINGPTKDILLTYRRKSRPHEELSVFEEN